MSGIMLVFIAAHLITYYLDFENYKNKIAHIHLQGIDIAQTADGIYVGEYDAGYIYVEVSVTVSDGLVTDICLLEHRHQRGKTAEQIVQNIITSQRTDIDAVSGATNSSLAIEKAVENALATN